MTLAALPFDLPRLHAAYETGVSAGDVMAEALRRIEMVGDPGIFLHLADIDALKAEAAALGRFDPAAKPLWGLPFAVKDNIDVAGMPTTAACPDFAYDAKRDAFVVARLRAAGAIPIGKTNLDQFATGLVGLRTPYPVPLNAIDPAIAPGGSSSGSGVAVAHGLVAFSLGTDTAGSGRVPAALNNIVGLKPSLGALSSSGMLPACRTLDTVSVFAQTVEDAYRVFQECAGYDAEDDYSKAMPAPALAPPPKRFKVGAPTQASRRFFGDDVQAESFGRALDSLAALGGEIVEIDFTPLYDVAGLLYDGPWVAERYAAIRQVIEANPDALHPVTRQIVESATRYSAADTFEAFYKLAALRRQAEPLLAGVDILCAPSIPTFYSVADLEADPIGPNSRFGTYTNFVNLLDLCGLAAPTGPRSDGRPGSVTLLAPAGEDALVVAIAASLHRAAGPSLGATGWGLPPAPAPAPAAPREDEIAVALVGAHMEGLPLNHEVSDRGGRFLYAGTTTPEYRLFSLAGGPPHRPGMIRDPNGAAIALEVWAMPRTAFGGFMAGIPQPLGIGTVNLADGSKVKGFLCEPAGLQGASDITECGGWRAFLASQKQAQPA